MRSGSICLWLEAFSQQAGTEKDRLLSAPYCETDSHYGEPLTWMDWVCSPTTARLPLSTSEASPAILKHAVFRSLVDSAYYYEFP